MTELSKFIEAIGRIGALYPGESADDFDPEEELSDDNDSPEGEEEEAAFTKAELQALNPTSLSDEAKGWLSGQIPPQRIRKLRLAALERM